MVWYYGLKCMSLSKRLHDLNLKIPFIVTLALIWSRRSYSSTIRQMLYIHSVILSHLESNYRIIVNHHGHHGHPVLLATFTALTALWMQRCVSSLARVVQGHGEHAPLQIINSISSALREWDRGGPIPFLKESQFWGEFFSGAHFIWGLILSKDEKKWTKFDAFLTKSVPVSNLCH